MEQTCQLPESQWDKMKQANHQEDVSFRSIFNKPGRVDLIVKGANVNYEESSEYALQYNKMLFALKDLNLETAIVEGASVARL
ncbi:unnamed protein product [Arctia plantaginis]|uniref:Uncharacterized protein n=1 Tax=Arctia plantaginis TaxID=874455 RepID=A0A8S1AZ45_ARCPL|nr:unnamed protein product [Arctia plantaginis]